MENKSKKKILVVEDDIAMRDILIHKLLKCGYDVIDANDGNVGEEKIIKEKPDLVLMDVMMPTVDGFTMMSDIRNNADPAIASTPIIVLSNLWSNADRMKAKEGNAKGYLVKAYYTTEEIANFADMVLSGKTLDF